jgi:molybdate transport system ATP-binding protein
VIEIDVRLKLASFVLEVRAALPSSVTAVLGPSGSGKTSLLETIAGLRRGARGRIVVSGTPLLDSDARIDLPPEARRIGYVPQEPGLFPHLTVRKNVRFGLRATPEGERRFEEMVELLEIGPLLERFPRTLSGGEAQRVALARAVVTGPRLLLLDEPLAALDHELKGRIVPYLLELRDEARIPMLYVTHHVGEAFALAERALVLRAGALVGEGPVADVLAAGALARVHPEATFENVVEGTIAFRDEARGTAGLRISTGQEVVLAVPAASAPPVGARAAFRIAAEHIVISRRALEGLSARNQLEARVLAVEPVGKDVIVRLHAGGLEWRVRLTPAAAEDLALAPERTVFMALKSHAFERLD